MNGGLIRRRLLELGMTREELAAKINCSASTINNALGGKRLGERSLFEMAKALGVTVEELIAKPTDSQSSRKLA